MTLPIVDEVAESEFDTCAVTEHYDGIIGHRYVPDEFFPGKTFCVYCGAPGPVLAASLVAPPTQAGGELSVEIDKGPGGGPGHGWVISEDAKAEMRMIDEAMRPPATAPIASKEACGDGAFPKTLGLIHQAIDSYVDALLAREHGGVAQDRAFTAICDALGRQPIGEMDSRRRAALSPHIEQGETKV